jgi:photosystem II oxygen-evolving enhancer protein 2
MEMLKRVAVVLLVVLSLSLTGCASATSGLKSYVDSTDGYQFLYPNGWLPVKVSSGPDVVFHDLIETSENVSVVISPVPEGKTLAELGTPGEVGYKLGKNAIAPPDSGREAELVNAEAREKNAKTYYLLEYAVKLSNQQKRHNLASVAVSRGKLFTFNASTPEQHWYKVRRVLEQVVNSFSVY